MLFILSSLSVDMDQDNGIYTFVPGLSGGPHH